MQNKRWLDKYWKKKHFRIQKKKKITIRLDWCRCVNLYLPNDLWQIIQSLQSKKLSLSKCICMIQTIQTHYDRCNHVTNLYSSFCCFFFDDDILLWWLMIDCFDCFRLLKHYMKCRACCIFQTLFFYPLDLNFQQSKLYQ